MQIFKDIFRVLLSHGGYVTMQQWDEIQNQIAVVIWFLSVLGKQLCSGLEPCATHFLLCGEEAPSVGKRAEALLPWHWHRDLQLPHLVLNLVNL